MGTSNFLKEDIKNFALVAIAIPASNLIDTYSIVNTLLEMEGCHVGFLTCDDELIKWYALILLFTFLAFVNVGTYYLFKSVVGRLQLFRCLYIALYTTAGTYGLSFIFTVLLSD